jgi:beta-carotene 3-hydroxylase
VYAEPVDKLVKKLHTNQRPFDPEALKDDEQRPSIH